MYNETHSLARANDILIAFRCENSDNYAVWKFINHAVDYIDKQQSILLHSEY